jgi:hypothetical protein
MTQISGDERGFGSDLEKMLFYAPTVALIPANKYFFDPRLTRRRTTASPIPAVPPVTSATLPSNLM